jgi:hypothetical protein
MRKHKYQVAVGDVFGDLTVVSGERDAKGLVVWRCRCVCGNEIKVLNYRLPRGIITSCGCASRRRPGNLQHGHKRGYVPSPTYATWAGMLARCMNPKDRAYKNYGERGITVCDEWRSFEAFLVDMGERPKGLTLDRIDNEGNYEPGNCRWATRKQQAENRRQARGAHVRWHTNRDIVDPNCPWCKV